MSRTRTLWAALGAAATLAVIVTTTRADDQRLPAPAAIGGDTTVTPEEAAVIIDGDLTRAELEEAAQTAADRAPPPSDLALGTTGVVIGSEALAQALAEIEASPDAADLVDIFPQRYPDLADQFQEYLLQYRTDGATTTVHTEGGGTIERVGTGPGVTNPLTPADVGQCRCILAMRADAMPARPINLYQQVRPHLWREGSQGPEASQWVQVNRTGNGIFGGATYIDSQLVESQVKFTMELRCRNLTRLFIFNLGGIQIRLPIWGAACPNQCEATIDNTGQLYLDGWTHLVRGLVAGANAEVMGFGFYGVNQQALINKAVQISKEIADLQFSVNVTIPGFGTLTMSNTGLGFTYNASATGPVIGVTWTSPGRRGDTFVNSVASNDYDLTVKDKAESIFKSASRVYAKGKGTAVSRANNFVSYGMGMHGFATCARESWFGHQNLWGYESHNGHNDDLRDSLRGFYLFHGVPGIP